VGHHHVAVRAGLLVEADTGADRERLGHVDLHVIDVDTVPDRLEQPVGEAEGEDVQGRLLAEEVVDPEDLLLGEGLVQGGIELLRAGEVGPEWLLHDDPGPVDEARIAEQPHHRQGGGRWDAQVVEPAALAAHGPLGLGNRPCQAVGPGGLADEAEPAFERRPLVVGDLVARDLLARPVGEVAEPLVVEIVERGPHDSALGHQAGHRQVEQTGQELAAGQVARRTEEHDDVRPQRRHQPGVDVVRFRTDGHVVPPDTRTRG
jgi:hypothetical protein